MWTYTYTDELYHYGVPGMRWGKRKAQLRSAYRDARRRAIEQYGKTTDKINDKYQFEDFMRGGKGYSKADQAKMDAANKKYKSDIAKAKAKYKADKVKEKAKFKEEKAKLKEQKAKRKAELKVQEMAYKLEKAKIDSRDAANYEWAQTVREVGSTFVSKMFEKD